MLARFVRSELTPLTFEVAAAAMHAALTRKLGWGPARPVLALALARTALETQRWQALHNYNWGNIRAGQTHSGSYCAFAWSEMLESGLTWFIPEGELDRKDGSVVGKVWLVPPGHPRTRFRAYADAVEGAHAYLEVVSSERYRRAWEALLLADALGVIHALKLEGYFAGDELRYARALLDLENEFSYRLARLPASEVLVPHRDEISALLAPDPYFVVPVDLLDAADEPRRRDLEPRRRASHLKLVVNDAKAPSSDPPGRVA